MSWFAISSLLSHRMSISSPVRYSERRRMTAWRTETCLSRSSMGLDDLGGRYAAGKERGRAVVAVEDRAAVPHDDVVNLLPGRILECGDQLVELLRGVVLVQPVPALLLY